MNSATKGMAVARSDEASTGRLKRHHTIREIANKNGFERPGELLDVIEGNTR